MYQSAIVEDEGAVRDYLAHTLRQAFQEANVAMEFDTFPSGRAFLALFERHFHYDVIFLDIEMPDLDGIALCRRIREVAPDSLVIFISNKEELVFQTFEVQPFRFVRKSQYQNSLPALVKALLAELDRRGSRFLQITEPASKDIYSFEVGRILYVEAQRKDCRIVTADGESLLRCKLMTLEEQLMPYGFLKPHRSYLVNCRYIFHIGRTAIQLTDGSHIPVSRDKLERVKEQFLHYCMD